MGLVASLLAATLVLQPGPSHERAYALLADNRVVAIDLPSGKVLERRHLGANPSPGSVEPGRMLAIDHSRLFALVGDAVLVLNTATLKVVARWRLDPGIRYRGLVLASDILFVYGGRLGREVDTAHHLHEQSAVVTAIDAANGAPMRTVETRAADGRNWWIYWASADAGRLTLTYHGGCYPEVTQLCTTGADELDLSGHLLPPLDEAHGMAEPYGVGWIVATGTEALVQYGSRGNVLRRLHTGIRRVHLMNFHLTRDGTGILAISSCLYSREGLWRVSIKSGKSRRVRPGICGETVIPGRTALVVRKTSALDVRDSRTAQLRRTLSFRAGVLDVLIPG